MKIMTLIFIIICAIVALVASYSALKHSFPQESYDRWQDLRRQMKELGEKQQANK